MKPRFPGCPPICEKTNLPAFKVFLKDPDLKIIESPEMEEFIKTHCPGAKVIGRWFCRHCKMGHFTSKPRPPSGDSSGSSRR